MGIYQSLEKDFFGLHGNDSFAGGINTLFHVTAALTPDLRPTRPQIIRCPRNYQWGPSLRPIFSCIPLRAILMLAFL